MADNVVPEVPDVPVPDEGFSVALVDEIPGPEDKTTELEAKIAELEAQNAALAQAPPPESPADAGFAALAAELKSLKTPTPVTEPDQSGPDYNEVIKDTSKNFYNDPTKSVLNLMTPVVQQLKQENDKRANSQAMQISKLTVLSTPGDKEFYVKYQAEVDSIAGSLPPSESAYQEALAKAKVLHVDDIVNEQVEARVNAALEQATVQAQASVAQTQRQAPTTLSTIPTKAPAQSKPSLTKLQWQDLQRQALVKGFDLGTAERLTAEGVWAIERYKALGRL